MTDNEAIKAAFKSIRKTATAANKLRQLTVEADAYVATYLSKCNEIPIAWISADLRKSAELTSNLARHLQWLIEENHKKIK